MRKFLAVMVAFVAVLTLAACGGKKSDIVLITDKGDITDRSFNQGAYEGVKAFGKEHKVSYNYIKPTEANTEQYISAIEKAIKDGAKVIVTPGFLFEAPINAVQKEHPDIKFIILDGSPANAENGTLESNVYSVFYAEEQSGFLAGYAAVMEGYRKLGFIGGMAVPAVQRFGHGYVQGAAVAAAELELAEGAIEIEYLYTGDFVASPEVQAAAAAMYQKGVEVIFACGGAVGQSVMTAAESANKKVIGVDVDQYADSPTVITSAMKNLSVSVVQALEAIYKTETWSALGGKSVILDAKAEGVSLPMNNSKFEHFTQAQYDAILAKLVAGTQEVSKTIGEFGDSGDAAKQFETEQVKVTVIPFG